jgi:hypothetical protein
VDVDLTHAVILDSDPNSGFASSHRAWWFQRGIDAWVLVVCEVNDGTCPEGHHQGGVVLHYCEGKAIEDFDRLFWSR